MRLAGRITAAAVRIAVRTHSMLQLESANGLSMTNAGRGATAAVLRPAATAGASAAIQQRILPGMEASLPSPAPPVRPARGAFLGIRNSLLLLHSANSSFSLPFQRLRGQTRIVSRRLIQGAVYTEGCLQQWCTAENQSVSTQVRHPFSNLLKLLRSTCRTRSFRQGEARRGRRLGRRRRGVAVAAPLRRRRRSSTLIRHARAVAKASSDTGDP